MTGYPFIPAKCPHTKQVERERGDFVKKGNTSFYVVEKRWFEEVPCGERGYVTLERLTADCGFDPKGIKVRCKGCGKEYYIFPGRGEAKELAR